ncbi:MAG: ribose 5-phosphate isomerase B [Ignavibacteriales bacterium]|nr:ribose 5-phosphate isomerase B [Ignavibacteriales bacterium]
MPRQLVTEKEIVDASKQGKKSFEVEKNALITAAAKDRALQLGISFSEKTEKSKGLPSEKKETKQIEPLSPKRKFEELAIAIGCDHGGFKYKETLKPYLAELGCKIVDAGTNSEEAVDYPEFAYAVARMVSLGEVTFGIVIDGAGIGSCMTANKVPNVRAACCHEEFSARNAREHNDANVLTLGSQLIGVGQMKSVVKTFLETWHGGGRHKKRVDKIMDVERKFLK